MVRGERPAPSGLAAANRAKPICLLLLALAALWAGTGTRAAAAESPAKRYLITDSGAVDRRPDAEHQGDSIAH